jgi:hypothetical protein
MNDRYDLTPHVDDWQPNPPQDDHFDQVYCASIEGHSDKQTYERRKKYVELFLAKVVSPQVCYMFKNGESIDIFSNKNVGEVLSAVQSGYHKPKLFFSKWDADPNHRRYDRYDFIPFNADLETINDTTYNLFQGFNKHIHHQFDNEEKLMQPFLDLVTALCEGNEDYAYFFLCFIATIVKEPRNRPPISFTFKGKQGTGKNMMLDTIGRLVGASHYITSSNPQDFFGTHAEGLHRKLLVNLNECEGKNTFGLEAQMKSAISEDTIVMNPKYQRPSVVQNHARLIKTTNSGSPFMIDVKGVDRREVVYETTDQYLSYNSEFWKELFAHFNKPEFIAALYSYLMNMDYSDVDWIKDRPVTQAYKQMCQANSPTEALFLDDFLGRHDLGQRTTETHILSKDMYSEYKSFCADNNFYKAGSCIPTSRAFKSKLTDLKLPMTEKRSKKGLIWSFTPRSVADHMVKLGWLGCGVPIRDEGINPFNKYK